MANWLPDTEKALTHSQKRLQRNNTQADDEHYQKLVQTLDECNHIAGKLTRIYQYVLFQEGQTAPERYQSYASPSETVEKLMIKMLKGLLELKEPPLTLINDEEAARLQAGLDDLDKLPPSLLENKAGNTFTNRGNGTQANHVGTGDLNINQGKNAPMVNSGRFGGSVNFYSSEPPEGGNHKKQK